jgi:prepilin-type N-terminal cleavage/methylation domain-containing protein
MRQRNAFTLIELLAAIAIGVVCVAALYVALSTQVRLIGEGNQSVSEAQMARNLMNRMCNDVRQSMTILPKYVRRSRNDTSGTGAPAATEAATAEQTAAATGITGAVTGNTSGTTPTTPSESTTETEAPAPPPEDNPAASNTNQYNLGVRGNAQAMYLYTSNAPRLTTLASMDESAPVADSRRIAYYYDPNRGLIRQEVRTPGTIGWDGSVNFQETIIANAAEVSELSFRYYHHQTKDFVTSWDGTKTGPPLMIEITLMTHPMLPNGQRSTRGIRQVMIVQVPAGQIPKQQTQSSGASSTQPAATQPMQ